MDRDSQIKPCFYICWGHLTGHAGLQLQFTSAFILRLTKHWNRWSHWQLICSSFRFKCTNSKPHRFSLAFTADDTSRVILIQELLLKEQEDFCHTPYLNAKGKFACFKGFFFVMPGQTWARFTGIYFCLTLWKIQALFVCMSGELGGNGLHVIRFQKLSTCNYTILHFKFS